MNSKHRRAALKSSLTLFALALFCGATFNAGLRALPIRAAVARPQYGGGGLGDPVSKEWLLDELRARRFGEDGLVRQVEARGSSFLPTADDEKELRAAGATDRVLEAVRKGYRRPVPEGGGGPGPTDPVDYTRAFRVNEVAKRTIITFKPPAGFTEEARKNRVEGVVRLRAVLAASGEVTDIGVVRGLPDGLTEKAVAAARQVKFMPAEKDGRKVSQRVVLEYNFITPVNEADLDERAVILKKPEAEYTEEARRNRVSGKVVLKVTLAGFGEVVLDSVEAGLPHGLTEKALDAARRIKFKPARLGGRPASQSVTVEYLFSL